MPGLENFVPFTGLDASIIVLYILGFIILGVLVYTSVQFSNYKKANTREVQSTPPTIIERDIYPEYVPVNTKPLPSAVKLDYPQKYSLVSGFTTDIAGSDSTANTLESCKMLSSSAQHCPIFEYVDGRCSLKKLHQNRDYNYAGTLIKNLSNRTMMPYSGMLFETNPSRSDYNLTKDQALIECENNNDCVGLSYIDDRARTYKYIPNTLTTIGIIQ